MIKTKTNEFEISLKDSDLLNHGLNIAMLSCNVPLFNDFYSKYKNELNTQKRNSVLLLFNSVFNNYDIGENLIEQIKDLISHEFVPAFVFSLSNYKNIAVRILILEKLKQKYPEEMKILNMLGNSYLEHGDKQKSFENFESAFFKSNNDPALLFSLISLSAELDKIDKLLVFINAAEKNFESNPVILEKLKNIKTKITSASN